MGKRRKVSTARPPEVANNYLRPILLRKTAISKANLPKEMKERIDTELMTYVENAYLQEPLTRKAILKRSHDVVERWLDINTQDEQVIELFKEFSNRLNLKNVLIDLLKNSMVYGAGYVEIVVENDDNPADQELPTGEITELALVSPKLITPVWDSETGHIGYYAHTTPPFVEVIHVHPSRIIYFPFDTIADGHRAVGIIEPMLHVIVAKIELDKASGNIPKKVISQIIAVNIQNGTRREVTEWLNALEKLNDAGRFVASDRVNFQFHEAGKALDIKPYSEHLIYQIAGGTGVPYTVLLGAGAGTLSTSETNLRDYYSDLKDLQVRLTPIIRRLFNMELELHGISADYEIVWREIYADEQSEAEVLLKKAQAIDKLINDGIITTDEAREYLGLPPLNNSNEQGFSYGVPVRRGKYAQL